MKQDLQQQAERMFFQTKLTKTEIANILGVSRTTLHTWARDNDWEQLKTSASQMPSIVANNCYTILLQLEESITAPGREGKPVTQAEVSMICRLTHAIHKLKNRHTLSESIELTTHFLDFVHNTDPEQVQAIKPLVDAFIRSRARNTRRPRPAAPPPPAHTPATDSTTAVNDLVNDLEQFLAMYNNPTAPGPAAETAAPNHSQAQPAHTKQQPPAPYIPRTAGSDIVSSVLSPSAQLTPRDIKKQMSKVNGRNLTRAERARQRLAHTVA
jgi:DNA-binding XRE family transcriptional regulator